MNFDFENTKKPAQNFNAIFSIAINKYQCLSYMFSQSGTLDLKKNIELLICDSNCFFWYMPQYIWEVFKH